MGFFPSSHRPWPPDQGLPFSLSPCIPSPPLLRGDAVPKGGWRSPVGDKGKARAHGLWIARAKWPRRDATIHRASHTRCAPHAPTQCPRPRCARVECSVLFFSFFHPRRVGVQNISGSLARRLLPALPGPLPRGARVCDAQDRGALAQGAHAGKQKTTIQSWPLAATVKTGNPRRVAGTVGPWVDLPPEGG